METSTVSDARLQEVVDCLNGCYETTITVQQIKDVAFPSVLLDEMSNGTFTDTGPRESILENVSVHYVGLRFPMYGDSQETKDEFYCRARGIIVPVENEAEQKIVADLDFGHGYTGFCRLEQVFQKQRELQTRFYGKVPDVETDVQYVKDMVLAMTDETFEALRETPWKPWKKSAVLDREAFKEELVDAWHFLVNLTLASGMDETEFFDRFCGKNEENHRRQDDGY